jgi:cytochrome P450
MDGETLQSPPRDSPAAESPASLPRAAYFDSELEVWVFSRYADVLAAFHEPDLCPVGPRGEGQLSAEGRVLQAKTRTETLAAFPATKLAQWESELEPLAQRLAETLPVSLPVDVVAGFARPWSLALAVRVTGANPADGPRLAALAAQVSASTADPEDAALKGPATAGGEELDQLLRNASQPMAGAAFVALSQTVPCLLANAWLILLNRPCDLERVRTNPEILPRAVEELLRVAGLARILHRQAVADVKIGDLTIRSGQRVRLMLEVANHDPALFPDPHGLDLSRRGSCHFALGVGQHSCAAAALIRMAIGVATKVFVRNFAPTNLPGPVQWHGGSGFRWPAPVYAQRRSL